MGFFFKERVVGKHPGGVMAYMLPLNMPASFLDSISIFWSKKISANGVS
jgi:hypothetical protein